MTSTDVAVRQQAAAIPAKLAYAKELANSGLLPAAYRKNPANVLWAVEYGDMLGLAPMAAMTGVHVIDGKPTASAGLISALVRRAGHKLRVSGDSTKATCQIVRADDRGYTFEVTFTIDDAKAAGLAVKDVWKKYAPSMLKARAITQCARDACEEALFGLHYTPEEMGAEVDEDGVIIGQLVDEPAPGDTRTWYEVALDRAGDFRSDTEADALYREAAAKVITGECTIEQATHVQNELTARVTARHKKAMELRLNELSEDDDDWRDRIRGLANTADARELLDEVGQLKGAGTLTPAHAGRIGAAIIARWPKSALVDTEATA